MHLTFSFISEGLGVSPASSLGFCACSKSEEQAQYHCHCSLISRDNQTSSRGQSPGLQFHSGHELDFGFTVTLFHFFLHLSPGRGRVLFTIRSVLLYFYVDKIGHLCAQSIIWGLGLWNSSHIRCLQEAWNSGTREPVPTCTVSPADPLQPRGFQFHPQTGDSQTNISRELQTSSASQNLHEGF